MKLHWSPRSPFVRKVMVTAHELGLADRIEQVRTVVAMRAPNRDLLPDNPLSKIPTLVLDDGTAIFDSLVICEYLDTLAGGRLFPRDGMPRWHALTRHALANGLLDHLILWRNEKEKPPERQTPEWLDSFALKTRETLARLERDAAWLDGDPFGIAHVTVGVLLGYLDFRFDDLHWRDSHPRLAAWNETFAVRPSARATEVRDG